MTLLVDLLYTAVNLAMRHKFFRTTYREKLGRIRLTIVEYTKNRKCHQSVNTIIFVSLCTISYWL